MRRFLLYFSLFALLSLPSAYALRTERPAEFSPTWDTNSATQLNNQMLGVWNVQNGRYQVDYLTATPNGSRLGVKGELVGAIFGGNDYLCVNTTGTTQVPTKVWKCAQLT